jgi:hypothetical protein
MLRLREEVWVHPHGEMPPAKMKRYGPGTPVTAIAETEGWQLCDDHFFDDETEHPENVVGYIRTQLENITNLGGTAPQELVDWVNQQQAAIDAEAEAEAQAAAAKTEEEVQP